MALLVGVAMSLTKGECEEILQMDDCFKPRIIMLDGEPLHSHPEKDLIVLYINPEDVAQTEELIARARRRIIERQ